MESRNDSGLHCFRIRLRNIHPAGSRHRNGKIADSFYCKREFLKNRSDRLPFGFGQNRPCTGRICAGAGKDDLDEGFAKGKSGGNGVGEGAFGEARAQIGEKRVHAARSRFSLRTIMRGKAPQIEADFVAGGEIAGKIQYQRA